MVGGTRWQVSGWRSFRIKRSTRKHLSRTASSGTSVQRGVGQARHFYTLPEKTEIAKSRRGPTLQGPLAENARATKYIQQKNCDIITADHRVVSEDCESRNIHRCADVEQDLATQWLQSCACETKSFQETEKSLQETSRTQPSQKSLTLPWCSEKSVKNYPWTIFISTLHRSEKMYCRQGTTRNQGRKFTRCVAIRFGRKVVDWFHVFLLSAKRARPLFGRENTIWTPLWRTTQWANSSLWVDDWASSDFCKRQAESPPIW